jgi:hypothetical protein
MGALVAPISMALTCRVEEPSTASTADIAAIRETGSLWNIDGGSASLRLDVEGPDDLAPLLGFFGNEVSKFARRGWKYCRTQFGNSSLNPGINKRRIEYSGSGGAAVWCYCCHPNLVGAPPPLRPDIIFGKDRSQVRILSGAPVQTTFFAKPTHRRLQRDVFRSVADLKTAINRFVAETNANPKPFVWAADPRRVLAAIKRGKQALESVH